MKTRLNEGQEFRTQLPVVGWVEDTRDRPRVSLEGMGDIPLKPQGKAWRFEFHVMAPGPRVLEVRAGAEVQRLHLVFGEQRFLGFGHEFGSFLVLFTIFMGGLILWTRKTMLKR